jgi:transcriptional regulator with XRE-family HTH domain
VRPENLEFIALLEASGWKPIDVARRLELSRGAISRYKSGDMKPSPQVLQLFKFILASEQPGALAPLALKEESLASWERKILDDLRWLHDADRAHVLKVIRTLIEGLPKREPVSCQKTKPVSSGKKSPTDQMVEIIENHVGKNYGAPK